MISLGITESVPKLTRGFKSAPFQCRPKQWGKKQSDCSPFSNHERESQCENRGKNAEEHRTRNEQQKSEPAFDPAKVDHRISEPVAGAVKENGPEEPTQIKGAPRLGVTGNNQEQWYQAYPCE